MKYIVEKDLRDFDFWSGAETVAKEINEKENSNECWEILEDIINQSEDLLTETNINDFIWFEAEDYLIEQEYIQE